jgi:hypothetical protein
MATSICIRRVNVMRGVKPIITAYVRFRREEAMREDTNVIKTRGKCNLVS